ncbi:Polyserase-2-like protein [Leptotrombidium deliense]|uniref:Polyserase-2-like protein n=1 Tax=Leptotrombidium deliense TaxID=299467 RepID=A0A443SD47_9ACAR|nr:Polyserase-2-like protein [Leptotrombidium deliense]
MLDCGKQGSGKTRIVNGTPVGMDTYPWMVALVSTVTKRQFCGGTLINDQWILTAAHCVPNTTPNDVVVGASIVQISAGTRENLHFVDSIWTHPDYVGPDDGLQNDIALLHLSNPVQFSRTLSPICLPNANQLNFTNLFNIGWGKVGVDSDASNDLLYIDTKQSQECYSFFALANFGDKQICTHALGNGICQGDSGGPLSSRNNGYITQVGINSYVYKGTCGVAPDVMTRVSSYLSDIYSVTKGANWCRNPNN